MAHEPVAQRFAPEATVEAMAAAIRERTAPADVRADYPGWLRARGVDDEDARALAAIGAERLLVYRSLVHNRLLTAIREFVPRAAARRGREALRADFAAFMELQGPRSPYLRDVPGEFIAWIGARWAEDESVPDWLSELARHELLELDVRNDPRGGEPPTGAELALDRALVFDGSARLMRYAFAVHRLPAAVDDRGEPERRSTDLLVFRDGRNKVRYLELTPWAGLVLVQLLVERHALADGLQRAAASLGEPLDDDKLGKAAMLFAELTDTGVLLGATPPPDPG
jgi:uncharacterized protein